MPVQIVTDSAADLPADQAAAHDIRVVPLTIRFGDDEYTDGVDLTPQAFYDKMAELDVLPATAAPSPGAFEAAFREAGANGDPVVCISLSSELSATMQSAQTAAKAFEGEFPVHVVDSRSITSGLGTLVLEAAKASEWEKKAMLAIRAGDDALARAALARKADHDEVAGQLKDQWEAQKTSVENLKGALRGLDNKIEALNADAIVYLCLPGSRQITGQTIHTSAGAVV